MSEVKHNEIWDKALEGIQSWSVRHSQPDAHDRAMAANGLSGQYAADVALNVERANHTPSKGPKDQSFTPSLV